MWQNAKDIAKWATEVTFLFSRDFEVLFTTDCDVSHALMSSREKNILEFFETTKRDQTRLRSGPIT